MILKLEEVVFKKNLQKLILKIMFLLFLESITKSNQIPVKMILLPNHILKQNLQSINSAPSSSPTEVTLACMEIVPSQLHGSNGVLAEV